MRFTTVFAISLLTLAVVAQADVPEPEIKSRTNDYEVSLEHLCPEAPSEEAAQCVSSYNLAQNVEQTILHTVKDVDYTKKYGKVFSLTECSVKKVPSIQFNLGVYCYFKGVKEWILEDFKDIKSLEEFTQMMLALGEMIQNETRPDFKGYFEGVFDQLKIEHDEMLKHDQGFRTDGGAAISEELGLSLIHI